MFGDQLKFGDQVQVELGSACGHVNLLAGIDIGMTGPAAIQVLCKDCNQWVLWVVPGCGGEIVQTNSEENKHVG